MNTNYESCPTCVYRKDCPEYKNLKDKREQSRPVITHEEITEWLPNFTIDEMVEDPMQF